MLCVRHFVESDPMESGKERKRQTKKSERDNKSIKNSNVFKWKLWLHSKLVLYSTKSKFWLILAPYENRRTRKKTIQMEYVCWKLAGIEWISRTNTFYKCICVKQYSSWVLANHWHSMNVTWLNIYEVWAADERQMLVCKSYSHTHTLKTSMPNGCNALLFNRKYTLYA